MAINSNVNIDSNLQNTITWINNTTFDGGFHIERSADFGNIWSRVAIVDSGTFYVVDSGINNAQNPYYYRVSVLPRPTGIGGEQAFEAIFPDYSDVYVPSGLGSVSRWYIGDNTNSALEVCDKITSWKDWSVNNKNLVQFNSSKAPTLGGGLDSISGVGISCCLDDLIIGDSIPNPESGGIGSYFAETYFASTYWTGGAVQSGGGSGSCSDSDGYSLWLNNHLFGYFDGENQEMTSPNLGLESGTMFFVIRPDSLSGGSYLNLISQASGGPTLGGRLAFSPEISNPGLSIWDGSDWLSLIPSANLTTNDFQVITVKIDQNQNVTGYAGETEYNTVVSPFEYNGQDWTLGGLFQGNQGEFFVGDIAEMIFFEDVLSDETIILMQQYLEFKYDL